MFQPHLPDTVTATAIIEGLAVAQFNKADSDWITTLLRNCDHYPKLTIRKVQRNTGEVINILKTYEIQEGDSISITVSNSSGNEWKFETAGAFDKNTADPQDLRWMLNIKELSQTEAARMNPPQVPTNSLTTTGGVFYTSVRTKETYRMRWADSQGMPSVFEELGITGKTFGVDFAADSVIIEVKGNSGFSETFNFGSDARYEMIFDNTCAGEEQPSPDGETDFRFYYELFNGDNGKVEIFPNEPAAGEQSLDFDPDQDPKEPGCQSILELP